MTQDEKKEFAQAMEGCEFYAKGLLLDMLALSEILKCTEKRQFGNQTNMYVLMQYSRAAEIISQAQMSAKIVTQKMFELLSEIEFYIKQD